MKPPIKLAFFAETGWGKTKALADLANAEFNVHVYDSDNNLRIARDYLVGGADFTSTSYDPTSDSAWAKLKTDIKTGVGPGKRKLLELTSKDVLVFDTTTNFARLCLKYVLKENQKVFEQTQGFNEAIWGRAQQEFMTFIAGMTQESIPCNVIFMSHVEEYYPDPAKPKVQLVPGVLGKALSPEFSRVFSDCWRGDMANDADRTRTIRTRTDNLSNLKCSSKALKDVEKPDFGDIFRRALT